jgi:hypothetical protein
MPAYGRGANLLPKGPIAAPKGIPKAPPTKGVTRAPIPKSEALKGGIPKAFEATPKLAKAYKNAPPEKQIGPGLQKLVAESKAAAPKPPKSPGLLDLAGAIPQALGRGVERIATHPAAIIEDIPKELKGQGATQLGAEAVGNVLHGVTGAVLGNKGPVAAVAQELTKLPAEGLNLPTQIAPTLYQTGKAAYEYKMGKPQALGKVETQLGEGSAAHAIKAPIQLLKGSPKGALKEAEAAISRAYQVPLQSGLEYSAAASLIDRGAGLLAKATKRESAPISAAKGSPTSRPAKPLIGNATEPQRPYGKGYVQNLVQRSKDMNPTRPGEKLGETLRRKNLSTRMRHYVDQMEGKFHGTMRQTEAVAVKQRADAIRGPRTINGRVIPGVEAVNLYNHGLLPDPSLRPDPLHPDSAQTQLQKLEAHYNEPNPSEVKPDTERIAAREAIARTNNDTGFHRNPQPAYKAALKMAEDKKALEPALQRLYGYTPEQMRNANLSTPFQHWFKDQQPWVEHAPPMNEKGIAHAQNIQRAREFGEARKTSLQELREAQGKHANAEITTAQLNVVKDAHKQDVAAHKQAVADKKASAPKTPGEHFESPFSIAKPRTPGMPPSNERIHLSPDEVAKALEAHGVRESQLAFMSHRPFRSAAGDLHPPPGVARGGVPPARGHRSGKAFLEGHLDLTHDGMARQYISNLMHIDRGHQNTIINRELGLTKQHTADLLQEHLANAAPAERVAIQARIDALRGGSTFFEPNVRRVTTPNATTTEIRSSAWANAQAEAHRIKELGGPTLVPYRIASPYAPGAHLDQIAHDVGTAHIHDMLSPETWEHPTGLAKFDEPHPLDRGEVGLMHKAAADRIRLYEGKMGSNARSLLGNMSTLWRKQNVAWSQKHIPGITQELGLRAVAYQAGLGNALRGYKALKDFAKVAEDPALRKSMPEIDHYMRELEHIASGGVIQQAFDQTRHLPAQRLENTAIGKLAQAFDGWKAHKVTGFPARMMADLGKGYMGVTNAILRAEQAAIGRPFRTAGFGKALSAEAQRLTGKKLPMMRQSNAVMQEFMKAQFNPKSIDMLAHTLNEWYGDFQTATPSTRAAQVISPFFTWYKNALKFIYHTLPVHHPIKTGILAALEGATEEQRLAEGQGYTKTLGLRPEGLQATQQGSVPSLRKNGNRWEVQYYTPQGSVSKGVEGLGDIFPYLEEPLAILKGRSSFTGRELPGHPEGIERVLLAFGSLAESFIPVERKIKLISEGEAEKAFLPIRDNPARNPKGELISPPNEAPAELPGAFTPSTQATEGQVYEK